MPIAVPLAAPPRWTQAVRIWLGFFPLSLLFLWLISFAPGFEDHQPLVVRVLLTALALIPIRPIWSFRS